MEKQNITFKQYRVLAMASRQSGQFKEPKIVRCKNGDWYVSYFFRNSDDQEQWDEYRERCGLNYVKDPAEKEKQSEILRVDVLNWLLAGNRPVYKKLK